MLELLTKEYILAFILAWLQTLYFPFKVCWGNMIKKNKTLINVLFTVRQTEIHVSMFSEAWKTRKHAFLSFLADLQFDFYFVEQDVEY